MNYKCYIVLKKEGLLPIVVRHKAKYFDKFEIGEYVFEEVFFFNEKDYKELEKEFNIYSFINCEYDMNKYSDLRNRAMFKLNLERREKYIVDDKNNKQLVSIDNGTSIDIINEYTITSDIVKLERERKWFIID